MTIHSSKGLEYKHVYLPFWNNGTVPMQGFPNFGEQDESPDTNEEEERRVAFVGITRAKKFVHISYHKKQTLYDGRQIEVQPSPFIEQVKKPTFAKYQKTTTMN